MGEGNVVEPPNGHTGSQPGVTTEIQNTATSSTMGTSVITEGPVTINNFADAARAARQGPPPFVDRLRRLDESPVPIAWDSVRAIARLHRWRQLFICCEDHDLGIGAASDLISRLGEVRVTVGVLKPEEGGPAFESELLHPELGQRAAPLVVITQLPEGGAGSHYDALAREAPAAHATRDELARLQRYVIHLVRRAEWEDTSDRVETIPALELHVERESASRPEARERFEQLRWRVGEGWSQSSLYQRVRKLDPLQDDFLDAALGSRQEMASAERYLDKALAQPLGHGLLATTTAYLMACLGENGLAERTFGRAMAGLLEGVQLPSARVEISVYKARALSERRKVPESVPAIARWQSRRAEIMNELGIVVDESAGPRRLVRFVDGTLCEGARTRLRGAPFVLDDAFEAVTRAGLLFDVDEELAAAAARFLAEMAARAGGTIPLRWWMDVLAQSTGRPHRRFALLVNFAMGHPNLRERVRDLMRALVDGHEHHGLAVFLAFERRADVDFDTPYWFRQVLERGTQAEKQLTLDALSKAMVEPNPRYLGVVVAWYAAHDVKPLSVASSAARDLVHALFWSWVRVYLAPLPSGMSVPTDGVLTEPLARRLLQPESGESLGRLLAGLSAPASLAHAESLGFTALTAWCFAPQVLRALDAAQVREPDRASALFDDILKHFQELLTTNAEHGNQRGNAFLLTAIAAWTQLAGDAGDTLLAELGARQPVEQLGDFAGWAIQIADECERVVHEVAALPGVGEDVRREAVNELDARTAMLRRIGGELGRARAGRVATIQRGAMP